MVANLLIVASALLAVTPVRAESHEYRYTGGCYQNRLFQYRLVVPDSLKPERRYPLLVWLHGVGENGSDNRRNLRHINIIADSLAGHLDFFILAVQCPPDNPTWYRSRGGKDNNANQEDMITVTAAILQKTMHDCPVDHDRVYLAGVSSGGSGCWEMAMRYPKWFAAVVPLASGGGDISRAANVRNLPIWAFHNVNDSGSPFESVQQTVDAIVACGGNAHLSLLAAPGHDCWTTAIEQYPIISWMLEQRRGALCWIPPGCHFWQWWHLLTLPCAVLLFTRLAWHLEQRRRKASSATVLPRARDGRNRFFDRPRDF
ncbi:MAG: PHB depolymerase family esterase [Thermoguttaceae bacterium]